MKSQPLCSIEPNRRGLAPVGHSSPVCHGVKQRGVVLFFTLIALLAMSLAAVALIRSVDTSALISGNLAYKQTVTTSADLGIAAAMGQLTAMTNASAVDVDQDASHPLNQTNLAVWRGYYSSFDPGLIMTNDATWQIPNGSVPLGEDASGNSTSYIIQRMCRTANVNKLIADCLLGPGSDDGSSKAVKNATQVCNNCTPSGQPAQTRITVRTTGPRNSISYVQSIVY